MPSKPKQPKKDFSQLATSVKNGFLRYRMIIFVVFVAIVYGFVFWQINKATNAAPSPLAVSDGKPTNAKIQNIDAATIAKIEQLKDNSVSVKALFDKARNNPFSSN